MLARIASGSSASQSAKHKTEGRKFYCTFLQINAMDFLEQAFEDGYRPVVFHSLRLRQCRTKRL